jgi:hypothetical protein
MPDLLINIYRSHKKNDWMLRERVIRAEAEKKVTLTEELAIFSKPSLTPAALDRLSLSVSSIVRKRVADHPNTPRGVLLNLEKDAEEDVRRAAAQNLQNQRVRESLRS